MRRLLLALAAPAALAGCGGDDEPKGPKGPVVTFPAGRDVRVEAKEYEFTPSRIAVERGSKRLKVTLANRGKLAHNLKVVRDGRRLGGTPTFPAGDTRSGSVGLPPGKYEFICSVGEHEELGMSGTLQIR